MRKVSRNDPKEVGRSWSEEINTEDCSNCFTFVDIMDDNVGAELTF